MKILLYTLSVVFLSFNTFAQSIVSSSNVEALAAQITIDQQAFVVSERVIEDVSKALHEVTITDKFLSVSEELGSVAVTNKKCIHTVYIHAFEGQWNHHDNPLHDMIQGAFEYSFTLVKTSNGMDVFKLSSKSALNVNYLSRKISMLDDVLLVDIPSLKMSETNILVNKLEDGYTFTFIKNNGSTNHHWKFYISEDGFVMFINKYKLYNS